MLRSTALHFRISLENDYGIKLAAPANTNILYNTKIDHMCAAKTATQNFVEP